ncbi:MAG: hypothetical protein LBS65_03830, partial [Desulfovibrio sp.]|nr:hypothetical protein [Desulfovibrio sp.]
MLVKRRCHGSCSAGSWVGVPRKIHASAWSLLLKNRLHKRLDIPLWSAIGAGAPVVRFGLNAAGAYDYAKKTAAYDNYIAERQNAEQQILSDLDHFSQDSKLAQRDPLLFEEAVASLKQGAPIQNVYIPAEALSDSYKNTEGGVQSALDSLGISREDYAAALQNGDDLVVPVEKYTAAIAANKEFAAHVADNRRLSEDGFTINELREFTAQRQAEVEKLLADAKIENEAANIIETESREIFNSMRDTLTAQGRPFQEARANAAQVAAFFGTIAARSKGKHTPKQLWERYAPDVRGAGIVQFGGEGRRLFQLDQNG